MSMAVMISIRPKHCFNIAMRWKTDELRRNKPNLKPPFKCYIYCTKPREYFFHGGIGETLDDLYRMPSGEIRFGYSGELMCCDEPYGADNFLNGKVIGEFVCDGIRKWNPPYPPKSHIDTDILYTTRLDYEEFMEYAGDQSVYGWHISNLIVYEKPKALSEFSQCHKCEYMGVCHDKCWKPLERAPQSWCYVEELSDG